jgi:hypothetical protein
MDVSIFSYLCPCCCRDSEVHGSRLRSFDVLALPVLLRPHSCRNCTKRIYAVF